MKTRTYGPASLCQGSRNNFRAHVPQPHLHPGLLQPKQHPGSLNTPTGSIASNACPMLQVQRHNSSSQLLLLLILSMQAAQGKGRVCHGAPEDDALHGGLRPSGAEALQPAAAATP